MILVFWMLSFNSVFSLSSFTFIKRIFSSSSLSAIRVVASISEVIDILPIIWFQLVLHPAWHFASCTLYRGLPWWLRGLRICLQCRRPRFNPWVGKIPWRREWQCTLVFLPEVSHGQRSLVGYSPWGQVALNDYTYTHTHTHTHCIKVKLNKQGDNIQPWHTPFPVLNQSIFPCLVLNCCFLICIRFLRRQVRWPIPISLRIFHSLLWSTQRL